MPAAGLGARPPSYVSSSNNSIDEGGFDEPSPKIEAKLKPHYDFEMNKQRTKITDETDQVNSLNYVDVGYRLNPDGSEANKVYDDTKLYDCANTDMHKKFRGNGFIQDSNTVYAIIKPEIAHKPNSPTKSASNSNSINGSPQHKTNNSPPVGVVSPIRRRDSDQSSKSTPPMSPALIGSSGAESTSGSLSMSSIVKGMAPIASLESQEEFEMSDLNITNDKTIKANADSPSAANSSKQLLNEIHDLEYADTSAGEDEEDILRNMTCELEEEDEQEQKNEIEMKNPQITATISREDSSLPDAMTADEAEQLLSSR